METIIEEWLMKKYEGAIYRITRERKEDLQMPNHLMGHRRLFLQLHFRNVSDLLTVRRDIMPLALANSAKLDAVDAYAEVVNATSAAATNIELEGEWAADGEDSQAGSSARWGTGSRDKDPREGIIDIREYDVPYYLRVAMDNDIRVGLWYAVSFTQGQPAFKHLAARVKRADPVVMAYDIETTKAPLKFPDQAVDQVMMISYMIDGQGYLITNREIVSEDIDDFEYTPKEGYEGPFTVFNEPDEVSFYRACTADCCLYASQAATIRRWFSHIQDVKPTVMATFNGDFFDFPFLCARAKVHGIDMFLESGFAKDSEDEFKSRGCVHMDCFRWVKRDSYLPQGSQGLKAVTTAKLGYDPIELDPELMTPYAYIVSRSGLLLIPRQVCNGTTPSARAVFRLRCCGDVLSLHEICPSVHLLALQHYPTQPGRSFAERKRNSMRDPAYGERHTDLCPESRLTVGRWKHSEERLLCQTGTRSLTAQCTKATSLHRRPMWAVTSRLWKRVYFGVIS